MGGYKDIYTEWTLILIAGQEGKGCAVNVVVSCELTCLKT